MKNGQHLAAENFISQMYLSFFLGRHFSVTHFECEKRALADKIIHNPVKVWSVCFCHQCTNSAAKKTTVTMTKTYVQKPS